MSTADAVGILILIVLWAAFLVALGIAIGALIERRNRRK